MRAANDERRRSLREIHSSYNRRRGTGNTHSISFFYILLLTSHSLTFPSCQRKPNKLRKKKKFNHRNEQEKHSETGQGSYRA